MSSTLIGSSSLGNFRQGSFLVLPADARNGTQDFVLANRGGSHWNIALVAKTKITTMTLFQVRAESSVHFNMLKLPHTGKVTVGLILQFININTVGLILQAFLHLYKQGWPIQEAQWNCNFRHQMGGGAAHLYLCPVCPAPLFLSLSWLEKEENAELQHWRVGGAEADTSAGNEGRTWHSASGSLGAAVSGFRSTEHE